MDSMFAESKFKKNISNWKPLNALIDEFFIDCDNPNIPYWAKINDPEERKKVILEYQDIENNKKELEMTLSNNCPTNNPICKL